MSSINSILNQRLLSTHFQPIVDITRGHIVGYEALTRGPAGSALESPRALFAEATRTRSLIQLEECCWASALHSAARQASRRAPYSRVFINALPSTLVAREFERIVSRLRETVGAEPSEIVIEISEEVRIDDFASFRAAISSYRMAGYSVAIDDAGSGHSGLQMMAEIVPDLIKIDGGLVRDVDQHKGRRATIEAILVLARSLAIEVIAEGIEREEELDTLRDLGVQIGQGYLLGRPHPELNDEIGFNSRLPWLRQPETKLVRTPTINSIGHLATAAATVETGVELSVAVSLFDTHNVEGVVVLNRSAPVGLVMKMHAYQLLGRAYGRDLYLRRPVDLAATRRPLVVDHHTPLEDVSRLAMARDPKDIYDHIIVTSDSVLLGIVSVQRLLAAITDARVDAARNANPLTGLPGNAMIERELRNRIRDSEPVSLLHIDLDDFKAFNDVYGFHRGDVAISVTAELLARELEAVSGRHFLGHIGGDDFLAIVQADVAEALTERLGTEFQRQIVALYEDDDVRRGFICAADRAGVHQTFPLMTITIAAAFVEPNDERHYAQLLDALSAAKREAKSRKRARRISPRHVLAS